MAVIRKTKRRLIVLAAIILIGTVLELTGVLQYTAARTTAFLYVHAKYGDRQLRFQSMETSMVQDGYDVSYRDKKGQTVIFIAGPKGLPISILFDPLDPPG